MCIKLEIDVLQRRAHILHFMPHREEAPPCAKDPKGTHQPAQHSNDHHARARKRGSGNTSELFNPIHLDQGPLLEVHDVIARELHANAFEPANRLEEKKDLAFFNQINILFLMLGGSRELNIGNRPQHGEELPVGSAASQVKEAQLRTYHQQTLRPPSVKKYAHRSIFAELTFSGARAHVFSQATT